MTNDRDIDRLLDRWFATGPLEAPDRVIDTVADRIERHGQRAAWRPVGREAQMHISFKALAAMAAVVVIALVGFAWLGGSSFIGVGGPTIRPSPSPSPSADPSAAPSASPDAFVCEDDLPGCAGRLAAGTNNSSNFGPNVTFTVPPGWTNSIDTESIFKLYPNDAPGRSILMWADVHIADQTPACDPVAKASAGTTVQAWMDFLTSHPGLISTEPQVLRIGGPHVTEVQSVVVEMATREWAKKCPSVLGPFVALAAHTRPPAALYGIGTGDRLKLIVLEIDSTTVVIAIYGPSLTAEFVGTLHVTQPVIDTLRFGCGPSVGRACTASD